MTSAISTPLLSGAPNELARSGLDGYAQPAPRHLALDHQLGVDLPRHVGGDREPDPGAAGHDGRVDADDLAAHVHQGAAGVPGVDGGIGLEEVVEGPLADLAGLGADDAGGHGGLEPEG
jgi:hypothetical protein